MRSTQTALAFLLFAAQAQAVEAPAPRPEVWMTPPVEPEGRCLRELFTQPDLWKETRSRITTLCAADHVLNRQYTDDELRAWLPLVERWGLEFALEVGAVKPWGPTGKATFDIERPMWDRFRSLGARIHTMAMDEPLFCVRNDLKKPDAYAVEETARFVALVRQQYPDVRIGDIEPYPAIPLADLIAWIDALEARLKEYPHLKRLGLADDAAWYISVMRQGNDYALAGGSPDGYVVQSWIGAPSRAVPESEEWTFTRSVRDFCRRFVKPGK